MENVANVTQQVAVLRQQLRDLMQNKSYADAEIISASATLDIQLQEFSTMLREKRQTSMRSF